MSEPALPISGGRARWLALFLFLAGIALPECCLSGSHAFGPGMETFGAICRASV
jgi:hypothetical protein